MADSTISIKQGSTKRYAGTITDDNDDPVDLTGCILRGAIKRKSGSTAYPFEFTLADQNTNPGEFEAVMTAEVSATLEVLPFNAPTRPITKYLGDFEIEWTDGSVDTFFQFIAEVTPEVVTSGV